jgi:hypothetical protein
MAIRSVTESSSGSTAEGLGVVSSTETDELAVVVGPMLLDASWLLVPALPEQAASCAAISSIENSLRIRVFFMTVHLISSDCLNEILNFFLSIKRRLARNCFTWTDAKCMKTSNRKDAVAH